MGEEEEIAVREMAVEVGYAYGELERLTRECDEARQQRDALAQAMWEARAILGFDNDGDKTPGAMIAGMGWEGYREVFLRNMREQRQAYEEALDEIPDVALAADQAEEEEEKG